jgi:hypothetical protein
MFNTYEIEQVIYRTIEFDDEDMIEAGYSEPITNRDRREYLYNLMEDGAGGEAYGETTIRKVDLENECYIEEDIDNA